MRSHNSTRAGFSLVELSIVLVILGLLVGGVLGGRSLIHAATLRKVIVEREQIDTALNTFKLKYNAIPGDFNKAIQFWPASESGNGDGIVESGEGQSFWYHLALAGLVEGNYDPSAPLWEEPEKFYKPSASGFGHWMPIRSMGADPEEAAYRTNFFQSVKLRSNLMVIHPSSSTMAWGTEQNPTPEDMWQIDTKIDDGKPSTGILTMLIYGHYGASAPKCSMTDAGAVAAYTETNTVYNVAVAQDRCSPLFSF